MNTLEGNDKPSAGRWTLLRDIGVLQVKLVVDGMRDVILVPLSLIVGFISLAAGPGGEHRLKFYHLLSFGKQTERWIDLFGAVENSPEKIEQSERFGEASIDEIVDKLESYVVDEYKRGGVTTQAKEHLDKIIDAVQRKRKKA